MWSWLLALLTWAHLQLVEPIVRWWEEVVLGSWEEWLLALVRQGFEETTRFLNGVGAWFLLLFSKRSYREQLRRAWQENSWQQWWGEVSTRPSTLNALVANFVAQQQQQQEDLKGHLSKLGSVVCTPTQVEGARAASGAAPQSHAGGVAWWPIPARPGVDTVQRLRRQRMSLSARLERPVVFVQQSGMGILDELAKRRHGLIEDAKIASQLAVSRCFEVARGLVRAVFFLPSRDSVACVERRTVPNHDASAAEDSDHCGQGGVPVHGTWTRPGVPVTCEHDGVGTAARGVHKPHLTRSKSAHVSMAEMAYRPGAGAGSAAASMARRGLRRSRSYGRLYTGVSTFGHHVAEAPRDALSVIRAAGYPHELHTVTTDDGYVLRMERIPRPGVRDVVFFMHGVLDTSMAWVSGGVTGSQAFAAWEAGMDVWLGNSRGNAPRQHQDPLRRGWKYWQYNINHMGMYDIAAQLDHIHNTKCAELGAGTVTLDLDHLGPLAGSFFGGTGTGKRMPAACAAGAGMQLLPGRAVSTAAWRGAPGRMEHPSAPAGAVTGSSSSRMRHSNSDSNLYRWGSSNSVSSGDRAAPPDVAAPASSDHGAVDSASDAASTLLAPATPRQGSPQQQYAITAPVTTGSLVSAASLGRGVSSHVLYSPMASCDGSDEVPGRKMTPSYAAQGGGKAGTSLRLEAGMQRSSLDLEPSDVAGDPAAVWAGGSSNGAGSSLPSAELQRNDGADPAPLTCCPRSGELTPPGALVPGSKASFCHKAITLTVVAPIADEPPSAAKAPPPAAATAPTALTTFTLQAKTRTDFGPSVAITTNPGAPPSMCGTCSQQGAAAGPSTGSAGDAAGSGGAAASVLGVVSSVFGPAADAVTHAVTSAGTVIATAAVSATQLLQPSQHKPNAGASPSNIAGRPATTASIASPPLSASPFAANAAVASSPSRDAVTDTKGRRVTAPSPEILAVRAASPAGEPECRGRASPAGPALGSRGERQKQTSPHAAPLNGPSFRRACSTDHLAATTAAGDVVCSGSNTSSTASERAPERTASSMSAASGSSFVNGAAVAGAGAAWGRNLEPAGHVSALAIGHRVGSGTVTGCTRSMPAGLCPYKLRCVAHSLGGMSVLIHLINRLREGRPHHVNRLLLLTPAGFHKHCPRAARPIMCAVPLVTRAIRAVLGRSFCFPLYIPTPLGRALTFKLLLSASRIPGLGELLRVGFKTLMDGDISQWDRAVQMPHYSAEDMPAMSIDQLLHLIQLVSTDAFRLYDYGSPAANLAHYGTPSPPDVSSEYWRLDLPVHLVGGRRDGVIPPANIHRHLEAMRSQGVAVTYQDFDFGHLDFTFGVKEELRMYLMKVLRH